MLISMSRAEFTDDELVAYLDEMLPADRMAAVEASLRTSDSLRQRLAAMNRRRDVGAHSVGEIWRRRRLSCPSRTQLGSFLLGTLDTELATYIDFHIRSVGCRMCAANLHDLEQASRPTNDAPERRRRFFESSAGTLRKMSTKKR
ncbi:MAG: hypothetical protein AB7O26_08405 [Planctomycetaceae bacterium]